MAAITPSNLIIWDTVVAGDLAEFARATPDINSPVQLFPDVTNFIFPAHTTQQSIGSTDLIVFPTQTGDFQPLIHIAGSNGAVTEFVAGTTVWAGLASTYDVYRAQVDTTDRFVAVYGGSSTSLHARRLTAAGAAEDTAELEADLTGLVISSIAISPSGQYVYALIAENPTADAWDAFLYQYDLDNAGARVLLKTYSLTRAANPIAQGGLALGCHDDGTLYVGYFTVTTDTFDTFTYFIDKLDTSGTVLDTWQIHQYTNSAIIGGPGATASNDGFVPLFTTDIHDVLWGWFYRSGFDASIPGGELADQRLLELDLTTGVATWHSWIPNDTTAGLITNIWSYDPTLFQGLARLNSDASEQWTKLDGF